ncbi:hypothetical protein P3G55_18965 [Leptospira sp. 96542]|nr:hypothetical protein [Leptospira sp. 96542]
METLKDIWSSLIANVNERTSNPFTFAFVFSWIGWNYKFFLYIFDNETAATRIWNIAALYPDAFAAFMGGGFLYPFLTTCFFVFLWPFIAKRIISFYRARQIEISNAVKSKEEKRLVNQDEQTAMVRRHEKERAADAEELGNLRARVEQIREALQKAETELGTLKSQPSSTASNVLTRTLSDFDENYDPDSATKQHIDTPALPSRQEILSAIAENPNLALESKEAKAILRYLSSKPASGNSDEIAQMTQVNLSVTRRFLDELKKAKLVNKTDERFDKWGLSTFGRDFVVINNLDSLPG